MVLPSTITYLIPVTYLHFLLVKLHFLTLPTLPIYLYINQANDSPYGLAAAVMSADPLRCARVARALRVGVVWHNCSQPCFIQVQPPHNIPSLQSYISLTIHYVHRTIVHNHASYKYVYGWSSSHDYHQFAILYPYC